MASFVAACFARTTSFRAGSTVRNGTPNYKPHKLTTPIWHQRSVVACVRQCNRNNGHRTDSSSTQATRVHSPGTLPAWLWPMPGLLWLKLAWSHLLRFTRSTGLHSWLATCVNGSCVAAGMVAGSGLGDGCGMYGRLYGSRHRAAVARAAQGSEGVRQGAVAFPGVLPDAAAAAAAPGAAAGVPAAPPAGGSVRYGHGAAARGPERTAARATASRHLPSVGGHTGTRDAEREGAGMAGGGGGGAASRSLQRWGGQPGPWAGCARGRLPRVEARRVRRVPGGAAACCRVLLRQGQGLGVTGELQGQAVAATAVLLRKRAMLGRYAYRSQLATRPVGVTAVQRGRRTAAFSALRRQRPSLSRSRPPAPPGVDAGPATRPLRTYS